MANKKAAKPGDLKYALGQLRHCYGNWVRGCGVDAGLLAHAERALEKDGTGRYDAILQRLRAQGRAVRHGASALYDRDYLSETIQLLEREIDRGCG